MHANPVLFKTSMTSNTKTLSGGFLDWQVLTLAEVTIVGTKPGDMRWNIPCTARENPHKSREGWGAGLTPKREALKMPTTCTQPSRNKCNTNKYYNIGVKSVLTKTPSAIRYESAE